jgi:hypothetical protein
VIRQFRTQEEALAAARSRKPWVIEGLWSTLPTILYGKSEHGKSFFTVGMLAALVNREPTFIGKTVTSAPYGWRPLVLTTDIGSDEEYAERLYAVAGGNAEAVEYVEARGLDHEDWNQVRKHMVQTGRNLLVIDNATSAVPGDHNAGETVRAFFDEVWDFHRDGIPTLIVCHESEKFTYGPASPMGHSAYVQSARWRLHIRKQGNTGRVLTPQGNVGPRVEIKLRTPGDVARFTVVEEFDSGALEERREAREKARLDANAELADEIVSRFQGVSKSDVARTLAEERGGTETHWRNNVINRNLRDLLEYESGGRRWARLYPKARG